MRARAEEKFQNDVLDKIDHEKERLTVWWA